MSKIKDWSRAPSAPDNRVPWELAQSVVCVPALLAADQLKLFETLAMGPLTRARLAAKTDTSERAIDILIAFLLPTQMVVEDQNGEVSLTPLARLFMLSESRYYFGPFLRRIASVPLTAEALVRAARSGRSAIYDGQDMWKRHQLSPRDALGFAQAAHCRALWPATRVAEAGLFKGLRRLLDVGGGQATYAGEFARWIPELQVTLLDLEPVCALARAYLEAEGLAERVQVQALDVFHDAWPGPFDGVWMSDVLHDWGPAECCELLKRAFGCLEPGGKVFLNEVLLNESGGGPLAASQYGIAMLLATNGKQYRFSEIEGFLRQAGFQRARVAERCGVHSVVEAVKPRS